MVNRDRSTCRRITRGAQISAETRRAPKVKVNSLCQCWKSLQKVTPGPEEIPHQVRFVKCIPRFTLWHDLTSSVCVR